jgi:hypothetical protein
MKTGKFFIVREFPRKIGTRQKLFTYENGFSLCPTFLGQFADKTKLSVPNSVGKLRQDKNHRSSEKQPIFGNRLATIGAPLLVTRSLESAIGRAGQADAAPSTSE